MKQHVLLFKKKPKMNKTNKQTNKIQDFMRKKKREFSTKVLIDDMPETGLPFYVVICTMQSCGNFQGKGSTFIFQFNILKTLSFGLAMGMGYVMSASAIICSTV